MQVLTTAAVHDSTGRMVRAPRLMDEPTSRAGPSSAPFAAMTTGVAGACRTLTGCGTQQAARSK